MARHQRDEHLHTLRHDDDGAWARDDGAGTHDRDRARLDDDYRARGRHHDATAAMTPLRPRSRALAFSIFVGVIEEFLERREQQPWQENTSNIIRLMSRHRLRSIRYLVSARARFHVQLFLGFLIAIYGITLLLKSGRSFVAGWF